VAWLQENGVKPADAPPLLRAAGGRPADALSFAQAGRDPKVWSLLPKAMARGDNAALADWTPAEAVSALQKLCHDLIASRAGAAPRFFQPSDLPPPASFDALTRWSRELSRTARTVEHPFNAGLMLEALVSQARSALNSTS
jgi:DNA polymerase-3 subunit delta'